MSVIKPTTALFSQQTGLALQEFPPTPMTLMGEQLAPIRTLRSLKTIPSKANRAVPPVESAYIVLNKQIVLMTFNKRVLTVSIVLQH